jgi:putative membrane protein
LRQQEPVVLLILLVITVCLSAFNPFDRTTWMLEVFPILIALPILTATYGRFPFTPLLYRLMFLHALILIVGGHYSYARVPAGDWIRDFLNLGRNHFDRLGHFTQGFVPAMISREILLRRSPLRPGKWLFFFVVCVCLAISAFYELIEWWSAVILGQAANDFLGTQGDPWDTQWDMFLALVGAIAAQLTLSRYHDNELQGFKPGTADLRRSAG